MVMLAEGTVHDVLGGYRLVRRPRANGQPVVAIGPYYGELGFECYGYQDEIRRVTKSLQSQGKHVVVMGWINRHPMYELADEYWGITSYGPHQRPDPWQGTLSATFGEVERLNIEAYSEPRSELEIMRASESARQRAMEIVADGPVITVFPRKRHMGRDFDGWPYLMQSIARNIPDAKMISCCLRSSSYTCNGLLFLEDMVGSWNLMDVESELHNLAVCTICHDSGSQCVPVLSGARNLVLFCGMYPSHRILYDKMVHKFPGYCNLHICDETNVLLLTQATADTVIKFVSDNFQKWRGS